MNLDMYEQKVKQNKVHVKKILLLMFVFSRSRLTSVSAFIHGPRPCFYQQSNACNSMVMYVQWVRIWIRDLEKRATLEITW